GSLGSSSRGRVVEQTYLPAVVPVELGAIEIGVVVQRAALLDDDEVAIVIDAGVYQKRHITDGGFSGSTGQKYDRVGLRRLQTRGNNRNSQADHPAVG